jgi:hypothetical protein
MNLRSKDNVFRMATPLPRRVALQPIDLAKLPERPAELRTPEPVSLCHNADGSRLAALLYGRLIVEWSLENFEITRTIPLSGDSNGTSISYLPNSSQLLVGGFLPLLVDLSDDGVLIHELEYLRLREKARAVSSK